MKVVNRWVYVIVGCVALLLSGLVYAWSVLSGPIAAEFPQWSAAQLSLTFTIVMSFFCIGGLVGGFLAGKVSQKVYLWVSAALFLVGFLLSANIRSLAMLYIGFGVICGFASGFSYNAVLATVGKWFPDKQGLISGILLMGFGISSFLIGKLYQVCTPDAIGAWRRSFIVLGVVSAVVMAICGFFLAKVALISLDERSGKEKKTVSTWYVRGDSFKDAYTAVNSELAKSMTYTEILSLSKTNIVEYYGEKNDA